MPFLHLKKLKTTPRQARIYLFFALLLVFVTAAAWASAANSPDEDAWPFTDMDELRNTPGYDPNLYNDHTHVDYKDD